MPGSIRLNTPAGYLQYVHTKATKSKENIPVAKAYHNGDGKTIVYPFIFTPRLAITLPAFESDGTTPTDKTFVHLDRYRMPLKVTYSGNATP